jgi:hypothetical protein
MKFIRYFLKCFKWGDRVDKFSDLSLLVKEDGDNDDIRSVTMHDNWTEPTHDEKMDALRKKCEELALKLNGIVLPIPNGFLIRRDDGEDIVVQLKQRAAS